MKRTVTMASAAVLISSLATAQTIGLDRARAQAEERAKEARANELAAREFEQAGNMLALYTKLVASALFVCERSLDDYLDNDLRPASRTMLSPDAIEFIVDEDHRRVTLILPGFAPRTAVDTGSQGCVLLPRGADDVFFDSVPVESALTDAANQPWPMGDRNAVLIPDSVDRVKLDETLDLAFDDSRHASPQRTRALVVVHQGRIVAERYAPGFSQQSRHISWSMGKSITSALIGVLVAQGAFAEDDPAPIPEWHRLPDDPRAAITVTHLLQMSGGLDWERGSPLSRTAFTSLDDHSRPYFGAVNVFDYALNSRVRYKPGAVWRYLNCDPLSLGWIIKNTLKQRDEEYLTFPQRALFDKIGMRNMVLECDAWGNFIMTGFNYGTARDWARFGMLHLNGGVWQGQRILPEGWVEFVASPAPAAKQNNYGGQFWLNAGGQYADLPEDMFWAAGHHGQGCFIIPSRDIVIVRLGHSVEGGYDEYIGNVIAGILDAIE